MKKEVFQIHTRQLNYSPQNYKRCKETKSRYFFPKEWVMNKSFGNIEYDTSTVGFGGRRSFSPCGRWNSKKYNNKRRQKGFTRFKFKDPELEKLKDDFDLSEYVDYKNGSMELEDFAKQPKIKDDFENDTSSELIDRKRFTRKSGEKGNSDEEGLENQ